MSTGWGEKGDLKVWTDSWLEYSQKRTKSERNIKALSRLGFLGAGLDKDARILEVGCGLGSLLLDIETAGHKNVYGVDLLFGLLSHSNCKEKVINASCLRMPFKDDSFDALVIVDTLHHIYYNELEECVPEFRRILKDKGRIFVREPRDSFCGRTITRIVLSRPFASLSKRFMHWRLTVLEELDVLSAWLKKVDKSVDVFSQNGFSLKRRDSLLNVYLIGTLNKKRQG